MPIEKIIGPKVSVHDILQQSLGFPVFFYEWCRTSRRVFRLSDSMRELFDQTDTADLYCDEVPYPFSSFVMELETPIRAHGRSARTFVVLAPDQVIDTGSVLIPKTVHIFALFEDALERRLDVKELEKAVRKKKVSKVTEISRAFRAPPSGTTHHMAWLSTGWNSSAGSDAKTLREDEFPFKRVTDRWIVKVPVATAIGRVGLRLAMQLSIYLAGLDHHRLHETMPTHPYDISFVDRRATTSFGQLFEINGDHLIRQDVGEEEAAKLLRPGAVKRAHWRRGYYRRRGGAGNDPMAPKCIWVRPTLVNAYRLPRGSVPAGSASKIVE